MNLTLEPIFSNRENIVDRTLNNQLAMAIYFLFAWNLTKGKRKVEKGAIIGFKAKLIC